jgi:hypothetical protein
MGNIEAGEMLLYGANGSPVANKDNGLYRLHISAGGIKAQWRTITGAWSNWGESPIGSESTVRKIIDIVDNKVRLSFDTYDESEEIMGIETQPIPGGFKLEYNGSSYLYGAGSSSWYGDALKTLHLDNAAQDLSVVGEVYASTSGKILISITINGNSVWESDTWSIGSDDDGTMKSVIIKPFAAGVPVGSNFTVWCSILKTSSGVLGFSPLTIHFTEMVKFRLTKSE